MSRLSSFLRSPVQVLGTALACAVVFSLVWVARATTGSAPAPVVVSEGGSGAAGGATWRLEALATLDELPSGLSVTEPAPGAVFVVATFRYDSGLDTLYCTARLVGDGREWNAIFSTPVDPSASSGCDGRPSGTGEVAFEVPGSAVAELAGIEIRSGAEAVRLLGRVQ
ncbi:MAG: hypothetical protein AAGC63_07510 [Propionicimonas sp.]|nr:hypothetical protein [Propionicimonas sp.]